MEHKVIADLLAMPGAIENEDIHIAHVVFFGVDYSHAVGLSLVNEHKSVSGFVVAYAVEFGDIRGKSVLRGGGHSGKQRYDHYKNEDHSCGISFHSLIPFQ